jgi:Transposase
MSSPAAPARCTRTGSPPGSRAGATGSPWPRWTRSAATPTALATQLPGATRVLDTFHVIALAGRALTQVRQRVQQQTLGRRGRKQDPLYRIRRLLRLGAEHLTDTTRTRLEAGLQAGDPDLEVTVAWQCYQRLRAAYHHPYPRQGRRAAQQLLDQLPGCPIPEVARLGRTLRAWRHEILAYFHTRGVSSPPKRSTCSSRRSAVSATASATSTTGSSYCCTAASSGRLRPRRESRRSPRLAA